MKQARRKKPVAKVAGPRLPKVRLEVKQVCEFILPDLQLKFNGWVRQIQPGPTEPEAGSKWFIEVQQAVST